jgi:hypothetical protein
MSEETRKVHEPAQLTEEELASANGGTNPTGKIDPQPIVITHPVDQSSPLN